LLKKRGLFTSSETPSLPKVLFAEVSVKSLGGTSMFDEKEIITSENVKNFFSEESLVDEAVKELKNNEFDVLNVGEATINIGASPKKFEEVFKTTIEPKERNVIKESQEETTATFMTCPDTKLPGLISTKGSSFENLIEGVAMNDPGFLQMGLGRHHLQHICFVQKMDACTNPNQP